ncbi:MAG: hypothetical protein QOI66_2327 [Myxococcales bacterium]|jgi:hypothetical protein|nr:hypothetical protein [Myxococcales bacterium]
MRAALCLVLTVGFLQPVGCRPRPVPAGFPAEYLEMLQSMAKEITEQCDAILKSDDDCYAAGRGPPASSDIVVPLPDSPVIDAPNLKAMYAACDARDSARFCTSRQIDYGAQLPPPCDKMVDDPNWPSFDPQSEDGTMIAVSPQGNCQQRRVGISIVRHTPRGNEMNLQASFTFDAR